MNAGDLVVMGGATQHRWEHAIPKRAHAGPRMSLTFRHNPEPRLNLTYAFSDWQSVKFSYNRSAQYLRLMTNSMQLTWYDVWMPSTENIPSMTTDGRF